METNQEVLPLAGSFQRSLTIEPLQNVLINIMTLYVDMSHIYMTVLGYMYICHSSMACFGSLHVVRENRNSGEQISVYSKEHEICQLFCVFIAHVHLRLE